MVVCSGISLTPIFPAETILFRMMWLCAGAEEVASSLMIPLIPPKPSWRAYLDQSTEYKSCQKKSFKYFEFRVVVIFFFF